MTGAARREQRLPDGGRDGAAPPLEDSAGFAAATAVADAVLYEGYLLYPYRRSAPKNQVRWQFGVLAPRNVVEAAGPVRPTVAGSADAWRQQTEVLLEAAPDAVLHVRLRFLQLQHRAVERPAPGGGWQPVDALEVGGRRQLTFDEAVPREFDVCARLGEVRGSGRTTAMHASGGEDVELLPDPAGAVAGRLVRRTWPIDAVVRLQADAAPAPFPLSRVRVVVENALADDAVRDIAPGLPRSQVLRRSMVAAHVLVAVRGGRFLSLLEPPEWAAAAAAACTNVHTFPVLAGNPGDRGLVLSSPIILYDHPQIAPESPGPLFDSGEIDEILSLRTLTLTDEEKAEARATDPRAAALIDRVDAIPDEVLARLHGAVRSLRPAGEPAVPRADATEQPAWWLPGADDDLRPETDEVLVDGVPIAAGAHVRLRPRRRGTDAHDVFLDGRTAVVHAVFLDVDGARHVAVTLTDDPGAGLHEDYRRYWYFAPDEVAPLPTDGPW